MSGSKFDVRFTINICLFVQRSRGLALESDSLGLYIILTSYFLAIFNWACYFGFLSLGFFICKTEIIVPTSEGELMPLKLLVLCPMTSRPFSKWERQPLLVWPYAVLLLGTEDTAIYHKQSCPPEVPTLTEDDTDYDDNVTFTVAEVCRKSCRNIQKRLTHFAWRH